jgi:hypothetical protein
LHPFGVNTPEHDLGIDQILAQPRLIIPTLIGAAATAPGVTTPLFDGNVRVAIG